MLLPVSHGERVELLANSRSFLREHIHLLSRKRMPTARQERAQSSQKKVDIDFIMPPRRIASNTRMY